MAITVTGWLDVSYDPPTMAVSVFDEARMCEAMEGSNHWCLSVLNSSQASTAQWLASPGNPVQGLLDSIPHDRSPSGCPIVVDCLAWFEVSTERVVEAATHRIFIGPVVAAGASTPHSSPAAVRGDGPLIHYGREFRRLRE